MVLMTMHSAKGLEFPQVFLVGCEEGLFPGTRAIGEPEEMEEERRLCYVAFTRAKEDLTITYARQRLLYGHTTVNRPSRFISELPPDCVTGRTMQARSQEHRDWSERSWGESSYGSYGDYGGYVPRRPAPKPRPAVSAPKAAPVEYQAGNMVEHRAFGRGMVISVTKMGGDALLEIAFDNHGTRKLLANSASAHMTKL